MTLTRRVLVLGGCAAPALLSGCDPPGHWHAQDVTGSLPPLRFAMTDASDGRPVTAADFSGHIVLLYFGYTACPDVCLTTLTNLADAVAGLGPLASATRVLFVTVDPARDTLTVLKPYAAAFGPQVVALRGTADQIAFLARRYRVLYSVQRNRRGEEQVTHSGAVYVFDREGRARLLVPSLA